jgi:hypothetical protein
MYERRWYEIPAEVGIILSCGVITYLMTRSFYGLSKLPALMAAGATVFIGSISIYYGHRLRKTTIESLSPEERIVVAWRLVRRGAVGGLLGLLAAGFGFLGTYLIGWQAALLSGLGSLAISLALGLAALFIVLRAWRRSLPPE